MPDDNGVLILAETTDGALSAITPELLGIGRRLADDLGAPLIALLPGSGIQSLAGDLAALGADLVLTADHAALGVYQAEAYRAVAEQAVQDVKPSVLLIGQTPNGRDLAPRLAFRLGTGLVTDCTDLSVDPDSKLIVMTKPVFGGSALAQFSVGESRPQMATIRARAFPAAEPQPGKTAETRALKVQLDESAGRVRRLEVVREAASEGPRLKDSNVVVSGGRGLGGPENWHYIDELAEALGAAIGATRAVTDAGWVPPALQVGLTGITITPDLYITVGISGAVQHIAGCSGARNIVAINRDAEANIFRQARYGIIGDWKEVLPAFTQRVKELRGK